MSEVLRSLRKEEFTILGIDNMSSTFDTINRHRLIDVCKTFLEEDEVKTPQTVIVGYFPQFNIWYGINKHWPQSRQTTRWWPEPGTIHNIPGQPLEKSRQKKDTKSMVPNELAYADDVDFLFKTKMEAEENYETIASTLLEWNLKVNKSKTEIEITTINAQQTTEEIRKPPRYQSRCWKKEKFGYHSIEKMYTVWIINHYYFRRQNYKTVQGLNFTHLLYYNTIIQ